MNLSFVTNKKKNAWTITLLKGSTNRCAKDLFRKTKTLRGTLEVGVRRRTPDISGLGFDNKILHHHHLHLHPFRNPRTSFLLKTWLY